MEEEIPEFLIEKMVEILIYRNFDWQLGNIEKLALLEIKRIIKPVVALGGEIIWDESKLPEVEPELNGLKKSYQTYLKSKKRKGK